MNYGLLADSPEEIEGILGTLKKIVDWATALGLDVRHTKERTSPFSSGTFSFFSNVWIEYGTVWYNDLTNSGDILHELAHVAVTPSYLRPYLIGDLSLDDSVEALSLIDELQRQVATQLNDTPKWKAFSNGDEQAAIAWSFAAARQCGVDDSLPFLNGFVDEYGDDDGEAIHQALVRSCGKIVVCHPGVSCLFHAGMLSKLSDFPVLNKWLQF